MRVTAPSTCSWLDHSVSGLIRRTERPVQTRFRYAYTYRLKLARQTKSLTHYTKGTPSPLRAPTVCRHPVSGSISLPLSGCFSPFPHGTGSLSVSQEYLALPDGPGGFAQDFSCPALLRIPLCPIVLRIRGSHPLWRHFPEASPHTQGTMSRSYNPGDASPQRRFGLFPVRSPLLGESLTYFLFLQVLRCFSSLR